jgi:hypothetical protein
MKLPELSISCDFVHLDKLKNIVKINMRLLLISLGMTCLCCAVIFLYFRNRIGKMEQKVELMFQLIQEYEQNKTQPIQNHIQYTEPVETKLINVSDDEDSDSDEVSDEDSDEDSEQLNITETITSDIPSISLSGAEIKLSDDLDDVSDIEDDTITLEEVDIDVKSVEPIQDATIPDIQDAEDEKPLAKKSVKELKQIAEDKGFTNYKGLRKDKLVELLSAGQ